VDRAFFDSTMSQLGSTHPNPNPNPNLIPNPNPNPNLIPNPNPNFNPNRVLSRSQLGWLGEALWPDDPASAPPAAEVRV